MGIISPGYSPAFSPLRLRKDRRARIEALIENLLDILDTCDGDADLEEDNEDCCIASDDNTADIFAGMRETPGMCEDDEADYCSRGNSPTVVMAATMTHIRTLDPERSALILGKPIRKAKRVNR